MFRAVQRLAAAAAPSGPPAAAAAATAAAAAAAPKTEVPDVLVSFGNQADRITFVSHPGVMAVSKLLEMEHVTQFRAVLTQEDVNAITEFDPELAKKAQVAVDEGLAVNFQDLEYFDRNEFVAAFKKEQKMLQQARDEVLQAPPGSYELPKAAADYKLPQAPRSWRPETQVPPEVFEADPQLRLREELGAEVRRHLLETAPVSQIPK
ncbi:hypothetical protein, conserved [Eimeria tenella]|uniref:Uncharacterized protein n=1 Tax=Eimeria tenella TaxID=5802 RepID=U6L8V7_EIMTE|nr:hypothetical protein, conserved [Eimeria tenella]CDJ44230.1 hypothetical protein, conserved [Eimeria tenella]|eukprot:XP_013234979.1 hypothetical protein, conserved [Eimeria tenella]